MVKIPKVINIVLEQSPGVCHPVEGTVLRTLEAQWLVERTRKALFSQIKASKSDVAAQQACFIDMTSSVHSAPSPC